MDITQLVDAMKMVRDGGSTALLLAAIVGGSKGWYVWQREFDAVCRDRDEWKQLALHGLSLAEGGRSHQGVQ
jgi:hypothetical protein